MLDHLRYFQAVARCGSLSGAARVLQISQPGLTAVIKQLEESFGTRLLVRLRTGVSLTTTGEELLRFANESLARLDEVEQRIKGLECDDAGSFVIGCHESLGAYFLPQWMTKFLEANPRIQLSLSNAPSTVVRGATVERAVHFGLVVAVLPRRVARYCQDGRLRRLHPELPFIADEIHLLFRGDAHRTRAFVITKDAIVAHGRALDSDYEDVTG